MTILEILEGSDKIILANIDLLAKDYLEKKGKKLNKGCSSCVSEMVLTLKNYYKMTGFKFKRHAASYKNKKGDKSTISNSTMTDAKAVKFLKTNPKRIELFSEYPSNWKKLIKGEVETDEQKEERLAIEAEMKEAEKAKEAGKENADAKLKEVEKAKEEKPEEKTDAVNPEADKAKKALLKMSLKELRGEYPKIKATSITDFVNKVLAE